MESTQLTCELNGIKYLQFRLPFVPQMRAAFDKSVKDHEGIVQGIQSIHVGGLFSPTYLLLNVLIPEHQVQKFGEVKF